MPSLIRQILALFISPREFFKFMNQKGIVQPLIYFVLTTAITALILHGPTLEALVFFGIYILLMLFMTLILFISAELVYSRMTWSPFLNRSPSYLARANSPDPFSQTSRIEIAQSFKGACFSFSVYSIYLIFIFISKPIPILSELLKTIGILHLLFLLAYSVAVIGNYGVIRTMLTVYVVTIFSLAVMLLLLFAFFNLFWHTPIPTELIGRLLSASAFSS